MLSVAPPEAGATRFVDHMVEGAAPGVEIRFFRWKDALRGGYDVFHLHWPERLVRRGVFRTLVLLTLLKIRRVALVRTLHNVRPHEPGGRFEASLLHLIDRRTDLFIRLNDFTEVPGAAGVVTIPHPHYLNRVDGSEFTLTRGRVLYFGIIRPYKGVDDLLAAFGQTSAADLSLRFVGSAKGDRGDSIRSAEELDSRISSRLAYVPDDELMAEIASSELVVLPHRDMHNSGSTFLVLSLQKPVLLPRNPINEALIAEVGEGWIYLYDDDLKASDIEAALTRVQHEPRDAPDLSRRDWKRIGFQLRDAYADAVRVVRQTRS
ncbi:hypothetical protein [Agromyces atrinae]|uniref:Beta-1,4-mannosyltransferase n=1 Tax=Agromyces atrinae TaxID=592376 RepID=A0A4Q2M7S6_9MICO|nr:hypothetical protein [Agromyces atrinae]NYD68516.1 beta-1,4-mannosyltransferase [Agromyces atrinae]RXZ85902.1 hypothetical protein ESP50_11830 [Agromyces atrinae]